MSFSEDRTAELQLHMLMSISRLYHGACIAGKQDLFLDTVVSCWFSFFPPHDAPELQLLDPSHWSYDGEVKASIKFIHHLALKSFEVSSLYETTSIVIYLGLSFRSMGM